MPGITVRDIPDEMYKQFKDLAKRHHRSFNAEVIVALEVMIAQDSLQQQRSQALTCIIERRKEIPPSDVESVELLREGRAR